MIAEKKCKRCGKLHTVVIHKGKFWYDGEWTTKINHCESCTKEGEEELFLTGDYGNCR